MKVDCGWVISCSLFLAPESERRHALGTKSVGQASHGRFDVLICLFQTVRVWDVSTGSCLSSFNIGQSSASTVTTVSYDQVRDRVGFVRTVTRNWIQSLKKSLGFNRWVRHLSYPLWITTVIYILCTSGSEYTFVKSMNLLILLRLP